MSGVLRDGGGLTGPARLAEPSRRNWIYLLPLVLIAGLVGWGLWPHDDEKSAAVSPPPGLKHRVLAGPRGPSCIRLVVGLDVSGSMNDFAVARDTALAQLIGWSRDNLRADDELAVIDFAADAAVRIPPTRRDKLSDAGAAAGADDGRFTYLEPALAAIDGFPPGSCDIELVLISDAQLADLPSEPAGGKPMLLRHHVHDVRLLVPGDNVDVPQQWVLDFPEAPPTRFDGTDSDATALAFGQAIAGLTGQTLR